MTPGSTPSAAGATAAASVSNSTATVPLAAVVTGSTTATVPLVIVEGADAASSPVESDEECAPVAEPAVGAGAPEGHRASGVASAPQSDDPSRSERHPPT